MLDHYTTGPRKPSIYKVAPVSSAQERFLFAEHEALDHLGDASLTNPSRDVFGDSFQSLWGVAPRHPESGPANHVFIVEVVTDGSHLRLCNAKSIRHHGKRPRLGHLGVDNLDEPIQRPRYPPHIAHPRTQLRYPRRHVRRLQVDEDHLCRITAEPFGER